MELSIFIKILISLIIGGAIGLEREIHERHEVEMEPAPKEANESFIGIRTLSLVTALGSVAGLLYSEYQSIFLLITIAFLILVGIHYTISSWITKDIGVTTEIATIFSYLIGVLIALEVFPIILTLGLAIIIMLILASKEWLADIIEDVQRRELMAFIGYGLIALVVLPFLPNESYTLSDIPYIKEMSSAMKLNLDRWKDIEIINPFSTWLIVAIITGVDFAGYILERTLGRRSGLILTSLIGGFVSSTATTQSLAVQSKKSKKTNSLVAAALLASLSSFFSVTLILLPINALFVARIIPTLLILIASFGVAAFIFLRLQSKDKKPKDENKRKENKTIFSLKPALIFALMYFSIKLISKIAIELFGETGFLATAAIAGFTGIDATSITIAELSRSTITPFIAVLAFLIVNAVNLLAKTFYIFLQGSKEFTIKFGVSVAIIIALSFVGLMFV